MCIRIVIKEDDGIAWYKDGCIYINARWMYEWDAEETIIYGFIHEYIEHILGLGHENAVKAEKLIRKLLKRGGL